MAVVISLLDYYTSLFSYIPYWVAALLGILGMLLLLRRNRSVLQHAAAGAAIIWMVILPSIEWTLLKRFNAACDTRLMPGQSREKVEQIMKEFYKVHSDLTSDMFHPELSKSSDHCAVEYRDGLILNVNRSPD